MPSQNGGIMCPWCPHALTPEMQHLQVLKSSSKWHTISNASMASSSSSTYQALANWAASFFLFTSSLHAFTRPWNAAVRLTRLSQTSMHTAYGAGLAGIVDAGTYSEGPLTRQEMAFPETQRVLDTGRIGPGMKKKVSPLSALH